MKIETRAIDKIYSGVRALDRVSLEIHPGQVIAVVGVNGAGKTTLLRCLAGVSAPDHGQVYCDDEEFTRDNLEIRRRMWFLPDFPHLLLEYSLLQHLGLTLKIYGVERPGAEEAALVLMREYDLLPLAQKPLGALSRGQLYKAALVMLMTVDPEVWMLDEPFASGMDPHGIALFKQHARNAAARGRTVLFTTQMLDIAERVADRVCILNRGEVRLFSTIQELQAHTQRAAGALESIFSGLRQEEERS